MLPTSAMNPLFGRSTRALGRHPASLFTTLIARSRLKLSRTALDLLNPPHSTVTDLAKFLGLSTSVPRATAV
jgi:hypothetical protein